MRCFYLASGLKINLHKSCFYGIGLKQPEIDLSTNILNCQNGQFPITYLGLTVGANMNRINNWSSVIQIFENRLSNWKAATLSIGGRITLIRSVLDSLPTYYFSLFKAPVCVLEKLEKIRKNFFWGGSNTSKKIPWVSWHRVTAPSESGGLGLGNLHNKNLALLSKWWWRFRNEPHSLWVRCITAIHYTKRKCSPIPCKNNLVGTWLNIAKLNSHLNSFDITLYNLFSGQVGDGSTIRLWVDKWVGDEPLCSTFPDLFKLERQKDCLIKDRCTGNGFFSNWEWNWISPPATPSELYQLQEMLSRIQSLILTCNKDSWKWDGDPTGTFTTRSMKRYLNAATYGPHHWVFPWNRLAPLKTNILGWKLEMNRLPSNDQLTQRKITIPTTTCSLCKACNESSHHLFLDCTFADSLWTFLISWCKLPLPKPSMVKELFELHKDPIVAPNKSKYINLIILAYCWIIWKTRNECIFNNRAPSVRFATKEIKTMSYSWLCNRSSKPVLEWSKWNSFSC